MARSASGDGFSVKPKNTNTLDLFDDLMATTPAPAEPKVEPKVEPKKVENPKKEPVKKEEKKLEAPAPKKESAPKEKKEEPKVEKPKTPSKPVKSTVESRYNEPRKSITISVLEDEDMFLRFHAARNGISRQDLLEKIFTEEIDKLNAGDLPTLEEIKPYMKQLKEPTRFTAMLQADLIDDIKKAASLAGLRPTSFMAYAIHKAQLNEK